MIESQASARADLLGGTLDLPPIHLIIPQTVTLNVALELRAQVAIEKNSTPALLLKSRDYGRQWELAPDEAAAPEKLGPMTFLARIAHEFGLTGGAVVTTSSQVPAGSGLGGSSAMGMALAGALKTFLGTQDSSESLVQKVRGVESQILDAGPAGYQDYYPAVHGGILALHPRCDRIQVEQLHSPELAQLLEQRISLFFSGLPRHSGINNWEVYKKFFDGDSATREGLAKIAELSQRAYRAIKEQRGEDLLALIAQEGELRENLFPGIASEQVVKFKEKLLSLHLGRGVKVCGAGGGGCFLCVHPADKKEDVEHLGREYSFDRLNFSIASPLEGR